MEVLRFLALALILTGAVAVTSAQSQIPPNCEVSTVTDPDRQVLSCAFGVVIEMEAAADMGFADASATQPDVINLESGAILFEVEPGDARPQIRTPHAIAAVRGTVYVVDVTAETTSVFVVRGSVSVAQRDAEDTSVVLEAGDGVDVAPGQELDVQQWADTRVEALMARFGR